MPPEDSQDMEYEQLDAGARRLSQIIGEMQ